MGYYTRHIIRIINQYNTRRNLKILLKKISEISNYDFIIVGSKICDDNYNGGYGAKWYGVRFDMMKVSNLLPDLRIQVKGKGEDGEMWQLIYENGFEEAMNLDEFSDDDESDFFEDSFSNYISGSASEEEEESEEEEDGNDNAFENLEQELENIKIYK